MILWEIPGEVSDIILSRIYYRSWIYLLYMNRIIVNYQIIIPGTLHSFSSLEMSWRIRIKQLLARIASIQANTLQCNFMMTRLIGTLIKIEVCTWFTRNRSIKHYCHQWNLEYWYFHLQGIDTSLLCIALRTETLYLQCRWLVASNASHIIAPTTSFNPFFWISISGFI